MDPLLVLALTLSAIACGISVVTAWATVIRPAPPPDEARLDQLKASHAALDQAHTDLHDRVGQWMRRESMRRVREAKDRKLEDEVAGTVPERGTPEYKLYLRRLGLKREHQEVA